MEISIGYRNHRFHYLIRELDGNYELILN
jgi:hypothetical protein